MAEERPVLSSGAEAAEATTTAAIQQRVAALERRDTQMWAAALALVLLLSLAVYSFTLDNVPILRSWDERVQLQVQVSGLIGLVLLFSAYVVYQRRLIRLLRVDLNAQMETAAAQCARADALEQVVNNDTLTELYNRRFAVQQGKIEVERATRYRYPLTFAMIDIDNLKEINDSYGHSIGDAALKAFARRMKKALRSSDLPVRLAGDEFLLILPECTAESVPAALRRMTGVTVNCGERSVDVNFSAGWVQHQPGESFEQLLERADTELYADKVGKHAKQRIREEEANVRQATKLRSMGEMTTFIVHDLRNLLTVADGNCELALEQKPHPLIEKRIAAVSDAVKRAERLLEQILRFTRRSLPESGPLDLGKLIGGMQEMLHCLLGKPIKLEIAAVAGATTVLGDPIQVEQVIFNLASNARDAMPKGGSLRIAITPATTNGDGAPYVCIAVEDNGCGLSPELKERIFDPYFTTKGDGKGNGLGLTVVFRIVRSLGGFIRVESEPEQGTRFEVYLPAVAAPQERSAVAAQ